MFICFDFLTIIARVTLVLGFMASNIVSASDTCETWFLKQNLKQGTGCLVDCSMAGVGMGTSHCLHECPTLCNISIEKEFLHRLAYYPGLSDVEYALIAEYPEGAFKVYQLKNEAESITEHRFKYNDRNDESDAFRHFIWSALLSKEIGPSLAQKFLDAHELKGNANNLEKEMDAANNRSGLLYAEKLIKEGKFSSKKLEDEAMNLLKNNRLIVIEKHGLPK